MKVRWVATLLLIVVTLGACATPGDWPGQPTDPPESVPPASVPATDQPSQGIDFGTANADKSVMAQVTVDIGVNANYEDGGGTMTAVLRAVEVQNGTMTVRFALQWDNPAKPDSAGVRLMADILFDWDSAKLKPQARAKIKEIIAEIPQGAAVQVNGYTDALGTESYNLGLSKKRAQAVAEVIAADRPDLVLTIKGFGKADPVAPNTNDDGSDNPIGRAQNRRVEILY